jgi:hypothetical protein
MTSNLENQDPTWSLSGPVDFAEMAEAGEVVELLRAG